MAIKITKEVNGVLIDFTDFSGDANYGVVIPKKRFMPKDFNNITEVFLYNDRVVVNDISGVSHNLDLSGDDNSYNISHIETVLVNDIDDLFTKFIAIL